MNQAAWWVLAGLAVAAMSPFVKRGFAWAVRVFHEARSEALAKTLAPYLVAALRSEFQIDQLTADLAYVKDELTINGGETVKDHVTLLRGELNDMRRDLELLFGE